ncbi:unnamed protein product [Clonostachys chloroleuca]|uniref:FAD-binding PCMH-type domain-containing protein n=1 Tax=Clonostachys chloroleuca TaxID=1926264 RepID=A0AA35M3I5_9HYPO|nr:unnamed protein product [Clonostachys chloroleuca]
MNFITIFTFVTHVVGVAATLAGSDNVNPYQNLPKCKSTPYDPSWPSEAEWASLNTSMDGTLIRTSPVASSCYTGNPFGSPRSRADVEAGWGYSTFHRTVPESVDFQRWANNSCLPPNVTDYNPEIGCQVGAYPQFVANVTSAEQVAIALSWAASRNIRVVVKGTGHDLVGRSTGAYSLSIWTHNLRSLSTDNSWPIPGTNETASVLIAGSGNVWGDALAYALSHGRAVCTGADATVGLGGFTTGGGHGPMSGTYGLAADQVLQATVVTPSGEILVTNNIQNSDLFWAIRGGGGGQFGVVTEFVLLTYPAPVDIPSASLTLSARDLHDGNAAVANLTMTAHAKLLAMLPDLMDNGIFGSGLTLSGQYAVSYGGLSSPPPGVICNLAIWSFTSTLQDFNNTISSARDKLLDSLGEDANLVSLTISGLSTTANYSAFFQGSNSSPSQASAGGLMSSRLLGRNELTGHTTEAVDSFLQRLMVSKDQDAGAFLVIGMQGGPGPRSVPAWRRGAVNPVWRDAYIHLIVESIDVNLTGKTPWQSLKEAGEWTEANIEPVWREWAPTTGAYMNEANPLNGQWQHDFYGTSYDELVKIKRKYDPAHALYVLSGVDSDFWEYDMDSGKLCQLDL